MSVGVQVAKGVSFHEICSDLMREECRSLFSCGGGALDPPPTMATSLSALVALHHPLSENLLFI